MYSSHVYIGTNGAAAGNVDIYGNGDVTNRITINGSTNGTSWFNTGGSVGIGTTAPGYLLDVAGSSRFGTLSSASTAFFPITDVTTIGATPNLWVGARGNANDLAQIGMGYISGVNPPVIIGHKETDPSGNTKGSIFFATRDVVTDTAPTERMTITSAGNVGIGTTAPGQKLTVAGTIETTVGGIKFPDSTILTSASGNYVQKAGDTMTGTLTNTAGANLATSSGNVGIGTAAPLTKLHVYGVTNASPANSISLQTDNTSGSYTGLLFKTTTDASVNYYKAGLFYTSAAEGAGRSDLLLGVRTSNDLTSATPSNSTGLLVQGTTGYVGIGTAEPGTKLEVSGDIGVNGQIKFLTATSGDGFLAVDSGRTLRWRNWNSGTPAWSAVAFETGLGTFHQNLTVDGDVGIGTTSPGAKLEILKANVYQDPAADLIKLSHNSDWNLRIQSEWPLSNGEINYNFVQKNNGVDRNIMSFYGGKVGIATTAPTSPLTVAGTIETTVGGIKFPDSTILTSATGNYVLKAGDTMTGTLTNTAGANLATSSGSVGIGTTAPSKKLLVQSSTQYDGLGLSNGTYMVGLINGFGAANDQGALQLFSGGAETLRLDTGGNSWFNGGNVGIGTTTPSGKLQIDQANTGTPSFLGTLNAASNTNVIYVQQTHAGGAGTPSSSLIYVDNRGSNPSMYVHNNTANPFVVLSNGNVGIGSTEPGSKLTVAGTIETTVGGIKFPDTTIQTTAANTANYVLKTGDTMTGTLTNTAGANLATSSGSVGVGTATPVAKFEVQKSSTYNSEGTAGLRVEDGTTTVGMVMGADVANNNFYIQSLDPGTSYSTRPLLLNPNAGNVGIGLLTPTSLLSIGMAGSAPSLTHGTAGFMTLDETAAGTSLVFTIDQASPYTASIQHRHLAGDSSSYPIALNPLGGNVGIGTTGPLVKLNVIQTTGVSYPTLGTASGGLFLGNDSNLWGMFAGLDSNGGGWVQVMRKDSATAYNLALQPVGGSVGIGTTAPGQKLSVAGTIEMTAGGIKFPDTTIQTTAANTANYVLKAGDTMTGTLTNTAGANFATSSGSVGIGTASPDEKLTLPYNSYIGWEYSSGNSTVSHKIGKTSDGAGPMAFVTTHNPGDAGKVYAFSSGAGEKLTLLYGGNVGIGSTEPGSKLTVAGTIETTVGGIKFPDATIQTTAMSGSNYVQKAGDTMTGTLTNTAGASFAGNVGIGNTAPANILDVVSVSSTLGAVAGSGLHIGQGSQNKYNQIALGYAGTYVPVSIAALTTAGQGASTADLVFATRALTTDTAPLERMRITSDGNVGIGTTAPGQRLSVAGTIEMTSGSGGALKFADGTIMTSATGNYVLKAGDTMTGTLTNTATTAIRASGNAYFATSSGSVAIGNTAPGAYKLAVSGDVSIEGKFVGANKDGGTPRFAYGYNADASGGYGAVAMGYNAKATGTAAVALGDGVQATGSNGSVAIGLQSVASGMYATALGSRMTTAGDYSFGIGLDNTAGRTITAANTMAIMGGNVGIGTTAPANILDLTKAGTTMGAVADSGLHIGQGLQNKYNQIALGQSGTYVPVAIGALTTAGQGYSTADLVFATRALTTDTAPLERMRITSAGNIGIGTTETVYGKLEVWNGAVMPYTIVGSYNGLTDFGALGGASVGLTGQTSNASGKGVQGQATATGAVTNYGGSFTAAGGTGRGVEAKATSTTGVNYGVYAETSSPTNGYALYATGGKSYFSGNVGIGSMEPSVQLDVTGNIKSSLPGSSSITIQGYDTDNWPRIMGSGTGPLNWLVGQYDDLDSGAFTIETQTDHPLVFGTYQRERMRITNTGVVHIVGSLEVESSLASKGGGGSWNTYSDARLKNVMGDYKLGLTQIMALTPVRYQYKQDNPLKLAVGEEYIGLIAQDVQKVIPQAITTGSQGFLSLNADPIIWAMLNAIKEQQKEIEEKAKKIEALQLKYEALDSRLKAIEEKLGR
ncbi:MAG: tail fiber domain-containing protein [Dehalococcoidia bacterium]